MKSVDIREEWYDDRKKVSVVVADVTCSAGKLASGHLCGPASAYYLAKALASAALLAAETGETDEALSIQMKCTGPLGGFNVECTADGALRGYTEKKVLDEFDGNLEWDDRKVLGSQQLQVTRSVPGRIISQGISGSIDGYLAGSLQRRACIYLSAEVNGNAEVLHARGVLVEALPDSDESVSSFIPGRFDVPSCELLAQMGLPDAKPVKTATLRFECRCTPERAVAMLGALDEKERADLPLEIDVTCHMCGRTFTVKTA